MPTLTRKVRVRRIGLRRHLAHIARGPHLRRVAERKLDDRVARAGADELLGNVENGVELARPGDLHDHLPGLHHLARLGAGGGDDARAVGAQDRVAQPILGDAQLRLGLLDLGLGRAQGLLGLVELGPRRPAVLQELLLPAEGEPGLGQRGLRRGEAGLGGAQRVLLVLRVEPRDYLAGGDHVADTGLAFDEASVDAEGEVDLVLGADLAGEGNRLAVGARFDRDGAHGPRIGRARDLPVAARDGRGDHDQGRCEHDGPKSAAAPGSRDVNGHLLLLERPVSCGAVSANGQRQGGQPPRHGAPLRWACSRRREGSPARCRAARARRSGSRRDPARPAG